MILDVILLVAIILNLAAMSIAAFLGKKNLFVALALLQTILAFSLPFLVSV